MQVTVEELAMLIGSKEIEIFTLQKQIAALQKLVKELEPKPEQPKDAAP